jgi:hypothetical protein
VPPGTEDALFGDGVLLQVTMAWGSGTSQPLPERHAGEVGQLHAADGANWSAASNFDLGAYHYLDLWRL